MTSSVFTHTILLVSMQRHHRMASEGCWKRSLAPRQLCQTLQGFVGDLITVSVIHHGSVSDLHGPACTSAGSHTLNVINPRHCTCVLVGERVWNKSHWRPFNSYIWNTSLSRYFGDDFVFLLCFLNGRCHANVPTLLLWKHLCLRSSFFDSAADY